MRILRGLACAAPATALLLSPVAHAGPSSDGQSSTGSGLLNVSYNGDSPIEIDRTLNLDFGAGSAGSDHDN
ncbi:hypothetical protein GCM10027271_55330 [Saccharopolyspora gloriosae]|uniref:Uncharacterized protein n=1 Tax=Saccharopolyspora gloriosae TaxID=455344 RepID=A0A840NAC6_9PSEU|nr:hypothetical protein [Saccharopolyspora gloriosae]MBB5068910.1 hypothetical protein [Saccharopolyspora gloriosae]